MLGRLQKDVCLADFSTFGIGGPASFFLSCKTITDFCEGLNLSHKMQIPALVVGNGSNCLFSDQGFPGLVLHNALSSFVDEGNGQVLVGAGYSFSRLGVQTAQAGWSGLEFAAGIPGTVGGAVFMNAGASGQEVSSPLTFVEILEEGKLRRVSKNELSFGYRFSSLQESKSIIVGAGFSLLRDEKASMKQMGLLDYRKKTQPYNERSAGCVFRNPPGFSAGRLIEEVGLKGVQIGGAEISTVHANFIVNKGHAKASDVKALIQLAQEAVYEKKGVVLACEIRML